MATDWSEIRSQAKSLMVYDNRIQKIRIVQRKLDSMRDWEQVLDNEIHDLDLACHNARVVLANYIEDVNDALVAFSEIELRQLEDNISHVGHQLEMRNRELQSTRTQIGRLEDDIAAEESLLDMERERDLVDAYMYDLVADFSRRQGQGQWVVVKDIFDIVAIDQMLCIPRRVLFFTLGRAVRETEAREIRMATNRYWGWDENNFTSTPLYLAAEGIARACYPEEAHRHRFE